MNNQSIPLREAVKAYKRLEEKRIRFNIARIGSEGLCSHCKYQDVCHYSTTTFRLGCSRYACDGIEIMVTYNKTYIEDMGYAFEYQDKVDR